MKGERRRPPFRADHVGSLLRPPELLHARRQAARGEIPHAQLRAAEDAAIRAVVRRQEEIGLAAVTDGEFRRTWFHLDFLQEFGGVSVMDSEMNARFHTEGGEIQMRPKALRVTGRISRPAPIFVADFRFLASVARAMPKLTLPSPSMMHFRGGRRAIDPAIYPDMGQFYADLARAYAAEIADLGAAGCRYIQLDEVNLAYLCDPALAGHVRSVGEDPAALPKTYAGLINAAIAGRPADMAVCMHLCRGNFQSGWVAEGGYDPVAELLFNDIDVDGYFLEYDTPRAGSFAPLRFVPAGKTIVLGLVSSKTGALESKDELKRRIEEAARFVPLGQLALSPQCGFASSVEGNLLGIEEQFAKLRLVAEVAREVWG